MGRCKYQIGDVVRWKPSCSYQRFTRWDSPPFTGERPIINTERDRRHGRIYYVKGVDGHYKTKNLITLPEILEKKICSGI